MTVSYTNISPRRRVLPSYVTLNIHCSRTPIFQEQISAIQCINHCSLNKYYQILWSCTVYCDLSAKLQNTPQLICMSLKRITSIVFRLVPPRMPSREYNSVHIFLTTFQMPKWFSLPLIEWTLNSELFMLETRSVCFLNWFSIAGLRHNTRVTAQTKYRLTTIINLKYNQTFKPPN